MASACVQSPNMKVNALKDLKINKIANAILILWVTGHTTVLWQAKKPGELLYTDMGDFQNPGMPTVSISPQPLFAIKKADPYERTDYADITQFLEGNATLPPNHGNWDMEMKPNRPSKKKIQGKDIEMPV